MDPVNTRAKFEVRSFTRSWDNSGYWRNFGSPWIRPGSHFSKFLRSTSASRGKNLSVIIFSRSVWVVRLSVFLEICSSLWSDNRSVEAVTAADSAAGPRTKFFCLIQFPLPELTNLSVLDRRTMWPGSETPEGSAETCVRSRSGLCWDDTVR